MGLLAGCGSGRAVVQNAPDVGHAYVGRAARKSRWEYALLDPASQRILADFVASVGQVPVNLADGAGRKSGCVHGEYLHIFDNDII